MRGNATTWVMFDRSSGLSLLRFWAHDASRKHRLPEPCPALFTLVCRWSARTLPTLFRLRRWRATCWCRPLLSSLSAVHGNLGHFVFTIFRAPRTASCGHTPGRACRPLMPSPSAVQGDLGHCVFTICRPAYNGLGRHTSGVSPSSPYVAAQREPYRHFLQRPCAQTRAREWRGRGGRHACLRFGEHRSGETAGRFAAGSARAKRVLCLQRGATTAVPANDAHTARGYPRRVSMTAVDSQRRPGT